MTGYVPCLDVKIDTCIQEAHILSFAMQNCYVRALAIGYQSVGSVTAQKRGATKFDSGFSFLQCNLTGDGNVYLGRAWGEESRVVFAYTWMADVVTPEGWNDWGIPSRER